MSVGDVGSLADPGRVVLYRFFLNDVAFLGIWAGGLFRSCFSQSYKEVVVVGFYAWRPDGHLS